MPGAATRTHRHAADLHGQHGLELDDEHVRGAEDAQRQATSDGQYKIPFLVVCDAFQSEMTAFADLILPDTTYLERHDVMSMLDRPISEFDGPVDSVRIPVVPPTGECKPFQEVLIELGTRLKLPAFVGAEGRPAQVPRLPGLHRQLRDRAGFGHRLPVRLARQGRREVHARRAQPAAVGDVRAEQLRLPPPSCRRSYQYMRNWNQGYLEWAAAQWHRRATPSRS
jgi:anaerobic selenocysteine-containing dehydrogenase